MKSRMRSFAPTALRMTEQSRMTQNDFRGTSISQKDFDQGKILSVHYTPQAHYSWDTGVAIGRYLSGLREGKLLGTECLNCHRIVIPPRSFCERCFTSHIRWRELKDTGRINTFSICYVSWDAQRVLNPYLPAVIEIDGASAGCGILHVLQNVDTNMIKVGMKVKAVWRPIEERVGAITDILYFEPSHPEGAARRISRGNP